MSFLTGFVSSNLITLLLLIGFEFILFMNRKQPPVSSKYMQMMVAVILMISLSNSFGQYSAQRSGINGALLAFAGSLSWLGGMFYFLMCFVVIPLKRRFFLFLPQLLNMLVCAVFMILPGDTIAGREIPRTFSTAVMLFYLLCLTVCAVTRIRSRSFADSFIILYIVGTSLLMVVFSEMDFAHGYPDEVAAINVIFYYGYYAAVEKRSMQTQYVENKLELAQSKMTVLMAQIQPHFIFNSLMAIQAQCIEYPELYDSLDSFAHYLRSNFDSLGDIKPIPFERELENIDAYLALEKLNFGDRLRVERRIDTTDFTLPALSVEPLVENAVRHGTATFEEGGTVTIRVARTKSFVVVEVHDAGVGKRTLTDKQKKRRGIGIANVRARLAATSSGRLEIIPEENGTCARLILESRSFAQKEE